MTAKHKPEIKTLFRAREKLQIVAGLTTTTKLLWYFRESIDKNKGFDNNFLTTT
ncbi:MAG: hypothetical protein ACHQEB_07630 [Chitinophagales bacterium]